MRFESYPFSILLLVVVRQQQKCKII